jgi:hypothetical protein
VIRENSGNQLGTGRILNSTDLERQPRKRNKTICNFNPTSGLGETRHYQEKGKQKSATNPDHSSSL